MRRFLTMYKIEQKLFLKSPDVFVFNLAMPVVTLFLIGLIAGEKMAGSSGMTFLQSSFAAICAVGICCSAFMSIPIVIVDYRNKKILKRLYCSPCSPARLLAADVMCSSVTSALSVIGVTLVATIGLGYRMKGNPIVFAGAWFITMISMFSIGLMVASLCRTNKSLNVATSLLYFPMLLFSGATVPFELFPEGMQKVAGIMPLSVGIRVMKAASMGEYQQSMLTDLAILVVIAVVCSAIAVKTFRWE